MNSEELLQEFEKQFQLLGEKLDTREKTRERIDVEIGKATNKYQTEILERFAQDSSKHQDYIQSLYTEFKRIIYVIIVVIVGVSGYLGIEVNKIPKKITDTIAEADKSLEEDLSERIEKHDKNYASKFENALVGSKEKLKKFEDEYQTALQGIQEAHSKAPLVILELEKLRQTASGSVDKISDLHEESKRLRKGTAANYESLLQENRIVLHRLEAEIVALTFQTKNVRTSEDENQIVQAIVKAREIGEETLVSKLFELFDRQLKFDGQHIVSTRMSTLIIEQLNASTSEIPSRRVLRIGLRLKIPAVIDFVVKILNGNLTDQVAREDIFTLFDVFKQGRFSSEDALQATGFLRVFLRTTGKEEPELDLTEFSDSLINLMSQIDYPKISFGAYSHVSVSDLSASQRKRYYDAFEQWFAESELNQKMFSDVLINASLGEKQFTNFLKIMFEDKGLNQEIKSNIARTISIRLQTGDSETWNVFFARVDWPTFASLLEADQLLRLRYFRTPQVLTELKAISFDDAGVFRTNRTEIIVGEDNTITLGSLEGIPQDGGPELTVTLTSFTINGVKLDQKGPLTWDGVIINGDPVYLERILPDGRTVIMQVSLAYKKNEDQITINFGVALGNNPDP